MKQIKLQQILFPQVGICTEENLFFRRHNNVEYAWSEDKITFSKDGEVGFNTYLNGFSLEKYFKYTKISNVSLKLNCDGKFRVTIFRQEKTFNRIITDYLLETDITFKKEQMISFPISIRNTSGILGFNLKSLEDDAVFYGGEYFTETDQSLEPVKIGIDICTYKREKFVAANVKNLVRFLENDKNSILKNNIHIFISDNGCSLPDELNNPPLINVYPNKNVGGAGGFTRGLIEIIKNKSLNISHVLIMDDDICFLPESVYRTYIILALIKEEYSDYFIGGAMLKLDDQGFQVESGAVWNTGNIISLKSGLNMQSLEACLYNEIEEAADYNAWWYCVVPIKFINENNLPLPLFIRGDDVEFGLRNKTNLILMNGICVWHEPFENKYSSSMFYYIFRNRLIDNAVRNINYSKRNLIKQLKQQVYTEIFTTRYKNAELLIRGVNDFLKGIDWLKNQDGELLHKELMQYSYKLNYIQNLDVPFSYPLYEQYCLSLQDNSTKTKIKNKIKKILLYGLFVPGYKDAIIPTIGARPTVLFYAKRVLNYDIASKKGFVTEKSVKSAFRCFIKLCFLRLKLCFKYKGAVKKYRKRINEISNMDYWISYLGLEK